MYKYIILNKISNTFISNSTYICYNNGHHNRYDKLIENKIRSHKINRKNNSDIYNDDISPIKIHDEVFDMFLKNDFNENINNTYKILESDNNSKLNNLIYINNFIINFMLDSWIMDECTEYYDGTWGPTYNTSLFKSINRQKDDIKLIKKHVEFKKNHELNQGYLWINNEIIDEVKKEYYERFNYNEYILLCKNAKKYINERDRNFIKNQIFNLNFMSRDHPINLSKYNELKILHKIHSDEFDNDIFEMLKPEIPIWLKGTLLEKIIFEIAEKNKNKLKIHKKS